MPKVTVRAKSLFKKNISFRTEWSIHSLERDVAAFRPKNDHHIVWHFSADDIRNRKSIATILSPLRGWDSKNIVLCHSPPFHYGLCFYMTELRPLPVCNDWSNAPGASPPKKKKR